MSDQSPPSPPEVPSPTEDADENASSPDAQSPPETASTRGASPPLAPSPSPSPSPPLTPPPSSPVEAPSPPEVQSPPSPHSPPVPPFLGTAGTFLSPPPNALRQAAPPPNRAASTAKADDVGKMYPWSVKDRKRCTKWLCPLEGVPADDAPECPLCYEKVPARSMLPCDQCDKNVCAVCYLRLCSTAAWQRRITVGSRVETIFGHVRCSFCRKPVNIGRLRQLRGWYLQHAKDIPFKFCVPRPPTRPRVARGTLRLRNIDARGIMTYRPLEPSSDDEQGVDEAGIAGIDVQEQRLLWDTLPRQHQSQPTQQGQSQADRSLPSQRTVSINNRSAVSEPEDSSQTNAMSAGTEELRGVPSLSSLPTSHRGQGQSHTEPQAAARTVSQEVQSMFEWATAQRVVSNMTLSPPRVNTTSTTSAPDLTLQPNANRYSAESERTGTNAASQGTQAMRSSRSQSFVSGFGSATSEQPRTRPGQPTAQVPLEGDSERPANVPSPQPNTAINAEAPQPDNPASPEPVTEDSSNNSETSSSPSPPDDDE